MEENTEVIGILLLTHGQFGKELIRSAEMIMGTIDNISFIPLEPETDLDEYRSNVFSAIDELGDGIVLTDLMGGTPCNTVAIYSRNHSVNAVVGVNLPMLLDCANLRYECSGSKLCEQLIEDATDGIKIIKM